MLEASAVILIQLSTALLVGLLLSRLAKLVKLPAVTAYLIAGILVGPFCLGALGRVLGIEAIGFTSIDAVKGYTIISEVALGFIAFSIGNEFRITQLKQIGKQATVIGIFQAVFTTVVVDAALIGFHFAMPHILPLPAAIVLGAVATATAPAATLMVVRQYKAHGPLTDILLPVVALDDAVGLVVFAISFGVARAFSGGDVSLLSVIVEPLLEVVCSLLLGALMGLLFSLCERVFHSRSKRMAVSVTFVLLTVAISMIEIPLFGGIYITFSPLLSCMMLGTIFCNVCDFSEELMQRADRWVTPLLVLFFVLSGAGLELDKIANWFIILIGVIYIATRSVGKYFGANLSARMVKCDKNIVNYLGITLLPQAGVALGMAMDASEGLAVGGDLVYNITLFAVLIYEIVGPMLTKISLTKAGDIIPGAGVSARHEARLAKEEAKRIKANRHHRHTD